MNLKVEHPAVGGSIPPGSTYRDWYNMKIWVHDDLGSNPNSSANRDK
jgi:hypothetical protein